jgi:CRP/FNR family transcriptional regulator
MGVLTYMAVQVEFLKSIPYFTGLTEPEVGAISRHVFERKAEKGEILSFEGEPSDTLYFVVQGVVKVFKTSADGKEQIFRIIRPGESFNDVPVLGNDMNLVSAEAMVPVVLNGIKKKDLEAVIRENPRVALNVIRVLSRRVQELVAMVEDFSFRHVTGRVARMLLEYADRGAGERPHLTQQEMAAMIGTAREMIGRSLKNLEGEGTIRVERNRIIITDPKALKELAGVA